MKHYDDFAIVAVLIKRKKLFLFSLCVCLILGSFWVQKQIQAIKQEQAFYLDQQESHKQEKFQAGFLQYNRYGQAAISDTLISDTLISFMQEDKITDYRQYMTTPYFSIYAIFYVGDDPIPAIKQALESHPITQETKSILSSLLPTFTNKVQKIYAQKAIREGFFKVVDIPRYVQDPSQRPINKHYIYLDKERLSQKGYSITSTEIIKNHQSLNSNKIWIFMIICSIMISVFAVFLAENFTSLRKQFRRQSK